MKNFQQQSSSMTINFQLHPLVQQLNNQIMNHNPFNILKFIKQWASKKLKHMYQVNDSEQDNQTTQKDQIKPFGKKNINKNSNMNQRQQNKPLIIKRRKALVYYQHDAQQSQNLNNMFLDQSLFKPVQKNQQYLSRIMISLKNQIFFQHLTADQINLLGDVGQLLQTQQDNLQIQKIGQPMLNFYILISGQIIKINDLNQEIKTYYSGQVFCNESCLFSHPSNYSYICKYSNSIICKFLGSYLHKYIQQITIQKQFFFQKCISNKQQFNYLDNEQREKLIACFKQIKEVMAGQIVMKGDQIQGQVIKTAVQENKTENLKRLYLVVKGQFSKCKRNLSGELLTYKKLKEGDFFGQQTLIPGAEIQYLVICTQDNSQFAYAEKNNIQSSIDSYDRIRKRSKMQVGFLNN